MRVKVDERLILQLAERLKQSARDSRELDTAQIQLIGLESVRRRAGGLWPELAVRVRESSLVFIKRRLSADDLVIAAGDGFLVVYPEPQGAAQKCRALQKDLDAFYLGDEATRGLSASVKHERLGAADLMERLHQWAAGAAEPPANPAELPLVVLPMWSVAQEAVTGYWITPDRRGRKVGRYSYDPSWVETGWHREDKDFLALDLRILERAVQDLQACVVGQRRCLVSYSVHATTLLDRHDRREFLRALAAVPAQVRPLLNGRIAEVQSGTPMGAVGEWVHGMRRISPRVTIEVHHTQRDLGGLEEIGLAGVACVMPVGNPTAADVELLARTIAVWSRDLKRQNLKLQIDNLDDPRLLRQTLDGQVDFCTSPRLWSAVPVPEGVRPYGRDQLLKALPGTVSERRTA